MLVGLRGVRLETLQRGRRATAADTFPAAGLYRLAEHRTRQAYRYALRSMDAVHFIIGDQVWQLLLQLNISQGASSNTYCGQ